jgi:hypothetical protein
MNAIATAATSTLSNLSNLVALLDETVALVANKGELVDEWAEDVKGMFVYSFCDKTYACNHPHGYRQAIVFEVTNRHTTNKIAPIQIRAHVVGQITEMCTLIREERAEFIGTTPADVAAAVPSLIKEIESRFAPVKPARRRR